MNFMLIFILGENEDVTYEDDDELLQIFYRTFFMSCMKIARALVRRRT
jgi:hypothetical protein